MFPAGMIADKWQKSHMTFLTEMGSIANVFTLIPADLIKSDPITSHVTPKLTKCSENEIDKVPTC